MEFIHLERGNQRGDAGYEGSSVGIETTNAYATSGEA